MKKKLILMLSMFFFMVASSIVNASAQPLQLNVNGSLLTDLPSPLIVSNVSYVPIRTLESLGYKVDWSSKNKTVTVSSQSTSDTLQLTVGNNVAIKNQEKLNLNKSPVIKNSTTYVPLRFITENFGATVDWNSKDNGIAIVTPDPNVQQKIKSGNLAKARLGAIGLPRIQFYISSEHPEGSSFSYLFTEKDFSKLYFIWADSIYYYELKNGYMSLVWEGKMTVVTKNNTSSPLAKYLESGIETIWGEQPEVTKRLIFFNDNSFSPGTGEYGIIDTNGKVVFSHKVEEPKQLSDIIVNFPEENQ